jgi:hypothetical protein
LKKIVIIRQIVKRYLIDISVYLKENINKENNLKEKTLEVKMYDEFQNKLK